MNSKKLILPRLISDGMVIQRRKSIHIWGWDETGVAVTATISEVTSSAVTDDRGRFDIYLPARESGGPYELVVRDDRGNEEIVRDVMIGLVWYASGQSNMELPIEMVIDRYPELYTVKENTTIRTFKITEDADFHETFEEVRTGSWKHVSVDTIRNFSATGYFFAVHLQKITGLTVGFIDSTLGGSRISAWMSRKMLSGFDHLIEEADKYADDNIRNSIIESNNTYPQRWRDELDKIDPGLTGNYQDPDLDDSSWKNMDIPVMFADTELAGFIGTVWFRRKFDLPDELAGKKARLFLGTIADRDEVYVNGVKVGETTFMYPPRKYDIPEGLTRKEGNTIVIRLCVEEAKGRFTPKKDYMIFNESASVRLEGAWKYEVTARCEKPVPPTDFINWKSCGLYNAMAAPCFNYTIDGIIWYQGESNAGDYAEYPEVCRSMIRGYREKWGEENLPFIFVQLPNFVIDLKRENDPWPEFRLAQKQLLDDPNVGMAVTMDVGEDNDLHPTEKEPVGERLALYAARIKYGYAGEYTGSEVVSAKFIDNTESGIYFNDNETAIELSLSHCKGLNSRALDKGEEIRDFKLVLDDGSLADTAVQIDGETILLTTNIVTSRIKEIRYLDDLTYNGALIYNAAGLPMGPFVMQLK